MKEGLDESLSGLCTRFTTLLRGICQNFDDKKNVVWKTRDQGQKKKEKDVEPVQDNLAEVLLPRMWPQLQHPWKRFSLEFKSLPMLIGESKMSKCEENLFVVYLTYTNSSRQGTTWKSIRTVSIDMAPPG